MSSRKALGSLLTAHERVPKGSIELIVKTQQKLTPGDILTGTDFLQLVRKKKTVGPEEPAPRLLSDVMLIEEDISDIAKDQLLSSIHVMAALSRWEGLNVNIFDAMSRDIPVIVTDMPPNSEMVLDGVNGFLVPANEIGKRPNGIPILEPDADALAEILLHITEAGVLENLSMGMRRESIRWSRQRTMDALALLIARVHAST